ncbi:uncharacterized protein LOC122068832 [Macadamia integrifolia]|uniref:uncharacterized protein LOC122068832 n=1 Tax=Macadamia integrifolia TaxID=60698 RepID=UPI001C4F7397|nr:uncharacterized protein LOC122068832 [Macadamia integrifolia]
MAQFGYVISIPTSVAFQVILTLFGSFRNQSSKKWFIFLLWSAYQLADIAATAALGIVSSFSSMNMENLAPIWSSFLLMHLGGPDSISAISLVDNELCFRHLIQLIYRVGIAGYIHFKLLYFDYVYGNEGLKFAAFMFMLLAGISKYAERTWALYSANMARLRNSMLPPPNSGPTPLIPNGDDDDDDNDVGDAHQSIPIPMTEYASESTSTPTPTEEDGTVYSDKEILLRGYQYFCSFRCLFVDLMVPCSRIMDIREFYLQCRCEVAFQLIDVELRFVYDMLFTKVPVVRTHLACILRFLRISVLIYTLMEFLNNILIPRSRRMPGYGILFFDRLLFTNPLVALIIFGWAFVQEMFEVTQMLLSEWTIVWLINHNLNWLATIILNRLISCRLLVSKTSHDGSGVRGVVISKTATTTTTTTTTRRTSWWHNNSMAQYNLLSFCFKEEPSFFKRILYLSSWGKYS